MLSLLADLGQQQRRPGSGSQAIGTVVANRVAVLVSPKLVITERDKRSRSESDAKHDPGPSCDVEIRDDMHLLVESIIRAYALLGIPLRAMIGSIVLLARLALLHEEHATSVASRTREEESSPIGASCGLLVSAGRAARSCQGFRFVR